VRPPLALAVERQIGIGEELVDGGAVIGSDGDPRAAAGAHRVFIDLKILGEPIEHGVDNLANDARVAAFRNNQDKFVAAEAEHLDLGAFLGRFDETLADIDQKLIANRMAERVVDILEAVEIEQRDRDRPLGAVARASGRALSAAIID
jgi:hypothetical protein